MVNKNDDLYLDVSLLVVFFTACHPRGFSKTSCFILNVKHLTWKVKIPNFLSILVVTYVYFFHYSHYLEGLKSASKQYNMVVFFIVLLFHLSARQVALEKVNWNVYISKM